MFRTTAWRSLSAAPHRMLFFGGLLQVVAVMAFWTVELAGRYAVVGSPLATTLASTWAHAFLMLYGTFPWFIFGFLMTTYPRWMRGPEVPRRFYIATFSLFAAGFLAFYVGLAVERWLVVVGIALVLGGWASGFSALLWVYRRIEDGDRTYERALNLALAVGGLGILGFLAAAAGLPQGYRLGVDLGLWGFLLPVLFLVSHRMIPFFTGCVIPGYNEYRPTWALLLLPGLAGGHVLLDLSGAVAWLWLRRKPCRSCTIDSSM